MDSSTLNQQHPTTRSLLIPRGKRRRFFVLFTLMSLIGWVVGGIASLAVENIINIAMPITEGQTSTIQGILAPSLINIVFAVIFGADQALVVYRYISGWWWMLATSLGWLISTYVSAGWINYIESIAAASQTLSPEQAIIFGILPTILYIVSGIWLGLLQWLVLRRNVTGAWWWIFLPSISFLFISIFMWLLSLVQDIIPIENRAEIFYISGQGWTAAILGMVPGIGFCRLKKNDK